MSSVQNAAADARPAAGPAGRAGGVATGTADRSGAAVSLRGLTRIFGDVRALDGFDLDITPGELVALLGPSGCGKTTALRVLAGFERPDAGTVTVDGVDISRVPVDRRDMGMVFQSYSLFPTMNALDNVAFGLRMRHQPARQRRARAQELLDLVGLPELARRYPHQMSGGQQQRVALARALAIEPRVLLLDEPLSALDAKVREQLRDEIRRLQLSLGITTVFVTHDQEEALSLADRVGVMRSGILEQCAPPAELYGRPATPFVASFVGTMNRLPGVVEAGGRVTVDGRVLPVDGVVPAAGTVVDVLIRPEALEIEAAADGASVVVVTTFRGGSTRLTVRSDAGAELAVDVPTHRATELAAGVRVRVVPSPRPVLVETRAPS
ncbi:MAG: ABC transporter ATP-binding protein [Actinobacteria bacterium]|nr:ABC transporter ATP-binding protein [Actinomycetota bacterium]MBI3688594.1 ABC transporter ATP-binding protein [Actinomycetota bacterium]